MDLRAWIPILIVAVAGEARAEGKPGAKADAKPEAKPACRKVELVPAPTFDETMTGFTHDTQVRACGGGGGGCSTIFRIPAGWRTWGAPEETTSDCRYAAIEVKTGHDPGDIDLWMLDLSAGTAVPAAPFDGNQDHGGGRWMSDRYVYTVPGPLWYRADVYDGAGKRLLRIEASALAMSGDGRFVLGYAGEHEEGDRRIVLWDLRTLKSRVLDERRPRRGYHDVKWTAAAVTLARPDGTTARYALPR